jgi:AsmA protein
MKRVVFFLIGLVVLVLAAALALPFVIDPNQFRPMLETRLTQALGREVKVGNLKLSILAGKVEADDLSIAEDPAFGKTPFLKAHSLATQVELMPLIFSRQLNVGGITFDQPEITLIQSVKGTWNVSTMGAAAPSKTGEPAPASSSKLALTVHEIKITNGKLTLIEEGQGAALPRVFDQMNMDITDFSPSAQFPFKMSAHLSGGGVINLDGKAGPISESDAALTPAQLHYKLADGDLAASHFFDASTGIRGLVGADGDVNWTGAGFDAKGTVRGDKLVLAKGGSPAQRGVELDFEVRQDVVKHTGQISRGVVHLGKAVANLTGSYSLKEAITSVALKLDGTKMPMDELVSFLPALDVALPNGSSIKGGTMTMDMTSTGYLNNLTTKGSVDIENTSLQNFDLGNKMRIVESLAGLQGGANTDFQKLGVTMAQNNEGTALSNIQVIAPAIGELTGGGTISPQKALALKMRVNLHASAGGFSTASLGAGGIPFSVGGTVNNPQIHPDVGSVVKEAAKDIIGKEADKAGIGGIVGGFLSGKKKPQGK